MGPNQYYKDVAKGAIVGTGVIVSLSVLNQAFSGGVIHFCLGSIITIFGLVMSLSVIWDNFTKKEIPKQALRTGLIFGVSAIVCPFLVLLIPIAFITTAVYMSIIAAVLCIPLAMVIVR